MANPPNVPQVRRQQMICEVCDRTAPDTQHPCRFEIACSCWRGKPCNGTGKIRPVTLHYEFDGRTLCGNRSSRARVTRDDREVSCTKCQRIIAAIANR